MAGEKKEVRPYEQSYLNGKIDKRPGSQIFTGRAFHAIARYTLAVDRRGRRGQDSSAEQQTADFINCVAFDRAAEFAEKYFRQGMRVLVSGRIQTGSYVNKEGQKYTPPRSFWMTRNSQTVRVRRLKWEDMPRQLLLRDRLLPVRLVMGL